MDHVDVLQTIADQCVTYQELNSLVRLNRTARTALQHKCVRPNFTMHSVPLLDTLATTTFYRSGENFSLTPEETGLTFQLTLEPILIERVESGRVFVHLSADEQKTLRRVYARLGIGHPEFPAFFYIADCSLVHETIPTAATPTFGTFLTGAPRGLCKGRHGIFQVSLRRRTHLVLESALLF